MVIKFPDGLDNFSLLVANLNNSELLLKSGVTSQHHSSETTSPNIISVLPLRPPLLTGF